MNELKHFNSAVLVIALLALSFSASAGYYSGYIVNATNIGIDSATVNLYASSGVLYATNTTDSSGFYNFTDVVNGTYSINLSKSGYSNKSLSLNNIPMPKYSVGLGDYVYNLTVSNQTITALLPGWITGSVTDSLGTGVSGVTVSAFIQSTLKNSTTTDATGLYNLSVIDGSYTITASKTSFTSPSSTPTTVSPGAMTSKNFTMLRYPSLNGTILNASNTSQVLSGASIVLSQSGVTKYSTTTNSSGVYSISDVVPGMYDVSISLSAYSTDSTTNYDLSVGDVNKTMNASLSLIYPAYLNGTVTNSSGAQSGATITISQNGATIATATTDSNGVYSTSFPAGVTDITVSLSGFLSQSVSSLLSGNNYYTQNFALTLAPTPTPTPTPTPVDTGPIGWTGPRGGYSSTPTPTPSATSSINASVTPTPSADVEEDITIELSSKVNLKATFKKDSTLFKLTYTQVGSAFNGNITYRLPLNYSDYSSGVIKISPKPLTVISGSVITTNAVSLKDGESFVLTIQVDSVLSKSIASEFTAPTLSSEVTVLQPTATATVLATPGPATGLFTAGNLQVVGAIILIALVIVGFGFMRKQKKLKVKSKH